MTVKLPDPASIPLDIPRPTPGQANYSGGGEVYRQLERLGNTASVDSAALAAKIDNTQAEDALNTLRERELEMSAGENGYSRIRGGDVIKTQAVNTYSKRHDDEVAAIASSLNTPQQKQMFTTRARASAVGFKAGLYNYASGQISAYEKDQATATYSLEANSAYQNWNNQAAIQDSVSRVRYTASQQSEKLGGSEEEARANLVKAMSPVHASVALGAIAGRDFETAAKYIAANKGEMDTAALATIGKELLKAKEAGILDNVSSQMVSNLQKIANPSSMGLLHNAVVSVESGGADYKDGKPLTSSSGAKYKYQVLPSTASNPGYGIAPARSDTPEEYNRVGGEYLDALVREYNGDTQKALAAYNIGPDNVNKAIAMGGDWLTNLTAEGSGAILSPENRKQVIGYLGKVKKSMDSGGEYRPLPTAVEVKQQVRKELAGQPPELIAKAETLAEAKLNDFKSSVTQSQDEAMQELVSLTDAGRIRSVDDIPLDMAQRLGPKLPAARSYLEAAVNKASGVSPAATDIYYALQTDRDRLTSMSVADLFALSPDLGVDRVKKLVATRQEYIQDPDAKTQASVDSDQFHTIGKQFGYKANSKAQRAELSAVLDKTEEAIIASEKRLGRKLSREEKGDLTRRMFTDIRVERANTGWLSTAIFGSSSKVDVPIYKVQEGDVLSIPDKDRAKILSDAKALGVELTEKQLREEYVLRQTRKSK